MHASADLVLLRLLNKSWHPTRYTFRELSLELWIHRFDGCDELALSFVKRGVEAGVLGIEQRQGEPALYYSVPVQAACLANV